jgi:hypothetical protein
MVGPGLEGPGDNGPRFGIDVGLIVGINDA